MGIGTMQGNALEIGSLYMQIKYFLTTLYGTLFCSYTHNNTEILVHKCHNFNLPLVLFS